MMKCRLGETWDFSGRKWETWLPGLQRRLNNSITFLLWSSPASASATLTKLQDAKAGALTCCRRRSGVRLRILKVQKSMGLIKCICGSWGNWWKNFLSNCPLYFRSHGSSVKFQLTWKRKIWLLFLKREKQKDLGNYRPVSLTLCLARSLRRSSWELCSDT